MTRETLREYCCRTQKEYLLDEWDAEKNLPETPDTITSGSSRKMWWCCQKRHVWYAQVYSRSKGGSGCPYCTGKRPIVGVNDLATTMPELCKSWDAEKNAPLTPEQVCRGSHRVVWWRCPERHSWRARICSRAQGVGCPICERHAFRIGYNDLQTCYPALAAEWDVGKNGCAPEQVIAYADKRAWWNCPLGHSWSANIASRIRGHGNCPYCSGEKLLVGFNDLVSQRPELAAEWDYEKNGALRPEQVTTASCKKIWWICPLGHSYRSQISSRTTKETSCPYCARKKVLAGFNDLKSQFPEVAAEWDFTRNAPLTPDMVLSSSSKMVHWRCTKGHHWYEAICARTGPNRSGCVVCKREHT